MFRRRPSPILQNAVNELSEAGSRMLGHSVSCNSTAQNGTVVLGTLDNLKRYLPKESINRVASLHDEGCLIKSLTISGKKIIIITSKTDPGRFIWCVPFYPADADRTAAPGTESDR